MAFSTCPSSNSTERPDRHAGREKRGSAGEVPSAGALIVRAAASQPERKASARSCSPVHSRFARNGAWWNPDRRRAESGVTGALEPLPTRPDAPFFREKTRFFPGKGEMYTNGRAREGIMVAAVRRVSDEI